MINANITNHNSTHIGNFNINITFADVVTGFQLTDITFTREHGNGIANLTFGKLMGTGANYMIAVNVPSNVEGSFNVDITGQVDVDGTLHNVIARKQTFSYDTIFDVTTTFRSPIYRNHDEIVLPINFGEDVLWFDKTDLRIKKVIGSEAYNMDYYIVGEANEYETVFLPAHNTTGAVHVDITGEVVKEANLVREIVNVDPILISYNTLTPTIEDIGTAYRTPDGWWNIEIVFVHPVIGVSVDAFIIGVDYTSRVLYMTQTLDKKPIDTPPPFGKQYDMAHSQQIHKIGSWQYLWAHPSQYQARFFWLKILADRTPEIILKQTQAIKRELVPVPVHTSK